MDSVSSSTDVSSSFRLTGVNLFLTYPDCPISAKDAEASIKRKLKNYEWSIWGNELHADGTPHLHAFVRLSNRCNLSSPTCLDIVGTGGVARHGNYQAARDPTNVLDYVVKGGQVECFNIDLANARAMFTSAGRKRNATELIMDELQKGKDITEVAREFPEHSTFIMLHMDRIEKFFAQSVLSQARPKLTFEKAQPTSLSPMPWDVALCQWLNLNINQPRAFSQKQLWLWGPTCHGKTTLKIQLETMCRIYSVPNEDFYNEYKDTLFDLVIFDEYHGQKTIQWINSFVDGSVTPLRQKGNQTVKRKNLPIIILSNLSIRQCYHKVSESIFATINRRFEEIALGAPIDITLSSKNIGEASSSQ